MNGRTAGILTTSITAVMCGFPGILMLCVGAALAFANLIPGVRLDVPSDNGPRSAFVLGLSLFCLGIILMVIPVIVSIVALRNRPEMLVSPEEVLSLEVPSGPVTPGEPIPPAS